MKPVKVYYYLYYKLYKLWSKNENVFISANTRAALSLMFLEIWMLISIISYCSVIIQERIILRVSNPVLYPLVLAIIGSKIYLFIYSHDWKNYIEEFDQLSKSKNRVGSIIVLFLIIFIIANFFFSINLMHRLAKL